MDIREGLALRVREASGRRGREEMRFGALGDDGAVVEVRGPGEGAAEGRWREEERAVEQAGEGQSVGERNSFCGECEASS